MDGRENIFIFTGCDVFIVKFKIKSHRNSLSGTILVVYNSSQHSAVE